MKIEGPTSEGRFCGVLSDNERETIIEWLYAMTGYTKEYWENKEDDELARLFEENLFEENLKEK